MASDPQFSFARDYKAEADIARGLIVKKGTAADGVVAATAATDKLLGITKELGLTNGNYGPVCVWGKVKAKYGGTVVAGDILTSDGSSQVIAASATNQTIAMALEGGASGEYHDVWVTRGSG